MVGGLAHGLLCFGYKTILDALSYMLRLKVIKHQKVGCFFVKHFMYGSSNRQHRNAGMHILKAFVGKGKPIVFGCCIKEMQAELSLLGNARK